MVLDISIPRILPLDDFLFIMMQECVCTLVVDDSDEVSVAAQEFLDHLFSERAKYHVESDITKIFSRYYSLCCYIVYFLIKFSILVSLTYMCVLSFFCCVSMATDYLRGFQKWS